MPNETVKKYDLSPAELQRMMDEVIGPEGEKRLNDLYDNAVQDLRPDKIVKGKILNINSFDQWGVELGKELATSLGPIVDGDEDAGGKDGSTAALVEFVHRHGG